MRPLLLSSILLCSQAFAVGEGYTNFIRQTQQDTGVVWSMPVVPKGQASSSGVLEGKGSLFQLWTIESATAKDYLLDQKLVGAYLPAATIAVKTLDPYSRVPRTRADQPFTVTYQVSGLLAGANLPLASTRVLLEHHTAAYTKSGQTTMPLTTALSGQPLSSAYLTSNGTATLTFPVTNLKAADPTKVNGEEHFVIHALSDGTITQTQIASAFVQVWPVATGGVQGITAGQKIRFNLPAITATYTDVYPESAIWLQIYKGPEKLGTQGEIIPGSYWVNPNNYSAGNLLSVADYSSLAPDDDTYTIEMLTLTPFGLERLTHITFSVDRTLQIRAQMGEITQ